MKFRLAFGTLMMLGVGMMVLYLGWSGMRERDGQSAHNGRAELEKLLALSRKRNTEGGTSGNALLPADPRFVPAETYCGGDATCLRAPTTARSAVDYTWLRRHGYPSRDDLERGAQLDEASLQKAIAEGDLIAPIIAARRLGEVGRAEEGLKLLIGAAHRGSVYAYYAIADYVAERPALGGEREAAAYLRVAYLLGDDAAAQQLYARFGKLGPEQLAAVDMRAMRLYDTFAKRRPAMPRPMP